MALKYQIKDFATVGSDVLVGFQVTDDSDGQNFFIDKTVTKGSKSDNAIVQEAQEAAQPEIDEWVLSRANVGKTWDPGTKTLS